MSVSSNVIKPVASFCYMTPVYVKSNFDRWKILVKKFSMIAVKINLALNDVVEKFLFKEVVGVECWKKNTGE